MHITPRREPSLYRPRPVQPPRLSEWADGCACGFLAGCIFTAVVATVVFYMVIQ